MCKTSVFIVHFIGVATLITLSAYVCLNETGKLNQVKRQCFGKMMELKDDIKNTLK